jgi:hypothetical protein
MIKYESKMLVLDSTHTKEDQDSVNKFANDIKIQERQAILRWIENNRPSKPEDIISFIKKDMNV